MTRATLAVQGNAAYFGLLGYSAQGSAGRTMLATAWAATMPPSRWTGCPAGSLARLECEAGRSIDPRRFRVLWTSWAWTGDAKEGVGARTNRPSEASPRAAAKLRLSRRRQDMVALDDPDRASRSRDYRSGACSTTLHETFYDPPPERMRRGGRRRDARRQRTRKLPFIPAAAWPGTVHRYGYFPAFLNVTFSVVLLPGPSSFVFLPAILKSCRMLPLFFTVKTTMAPCLTESFESL